jgi:hypothetical protein
MITARTPRRRRIGRIAGVKGRTLTYAIAALAAVGGVIAAARRRARPDGGRPGPPPAGVREPRRPLHPAGSGSATADPDQE